MTTYAALLPMQALLLPARPRFVYAGLSRSGTLALSRFMLSAADLISKVTIVLHHTRNAENVGGTARAMANMGLARLVIAEPAAWDRTQAMRVATEGGKVLGSASYAAGLPEVLDRATLFFATSARRRKGVPAVSPEEAAAALLEEARRGGSPALVFGDERSGLPRWVIDRAHGVSTIGTSEAATSLNLAQSVLVHAYVLRQRAEAMSASSAVGSAGEAGRPAAASEDHGEIEAPMPAEDLARLRERARALLLQAGYLNPDQPVRILSELERLLIRAKPTEREGKLLLALTGQLEWACGPRND